MYLLMFRSGLSGFHVSLECPDSVQMFISIPIYSFIYRLCFIQIAVMLLFLSTHCYGCREKTTGYIGTLSIRSTYISHYILLLIKCSRIIPTNSMNIFFKLWIEQCEANGYVKGGNHLKHVVITRRTRRIMQLCSRYHRFMFN